MIRGIGGRVKRPEQHPMRIALQRRPGLCPAPKLRQMASLLAAGARGHQNNRRTFMIYEMRSYRAMPGRLPDLLKRFDTITLKLFDKHGIKQAGFWTTEVGESNQNLIYLVAYESMAEREKKWAAFSTDPEWIAKRAETEKNGPLVMTFSNQFLKPTSFSAVK
jgi:hypothetical protein